MRARFALLLLAALAAFPSFAAITGVVMTKDGQPLAGARVSTFAIELATARKERLVSKAVERIPIASVQSDTKGTFTIDSPQEPVVELHVSAKGYAPYATRVEKSDEVGAIALTRAETKEGTITAGGKGVARAIVVWTGAAAEWLAKTDENGHYAVPDPAKWAQRVMIVHPDYSPIDEAVGPLAPGRKGVDRSLEAGVALRGRVVSSDGSAAPKAILTVDGWPLASSGDDGSFDIAHAPRKWESLEARSGNLLATRARAGEGAVNLKLSKAASVTGNLRDAKTRLPIAGAEVRLGTRGFIPTPVAAVMTDAKGNFGIPAIAPGNYALFVFRPNYAGTDSNVSLVAGQTAQKLLTATPMARISGTVRDEDKRPVAAAQVSAQEAGRDPMMMMMRMRTGGGVYSGPDGRFVVRHEGEQELLIQASKKGFPTARSSPIRVAAGERKGGVVLTIPRGIAITGRVMDQQGKPLSGVTVTSVEAEGNTMMRQMIAMRGLPFSDSDVDVQTASDGTFAFRLKEGIYDLAFKREGFAPKSVRTVSVNATTKPLEVTMEPGASVTGRVVRNGAGVEGVRVGVSSGNAEASATTGPDGLFMISDLAPGTANLWAMKPEEFIQQIRNITVPARDVTIEVPAGGRLTGRVVEKGSKQPVRTFQAGLSGRRGGGGFMVGGPPQMKSFTSDDGTFALENLPAGQITLVVQAPGFAEARVPSITIEDGKSVSDVEVEVDQGVRLSGRVTGPDGSPLSGARVRANPASAGAGRMFTGMEPQTTTDASGEYVLDGLESGEKSISFFYTGLISQDKTVQLSGRETRLDVQLSSGMRVLGVVVSDAGTPVADAEVSANSGAGGSRAGRTDAGGNFQLEGLPPGRYMFRASKAGVGIGELRDHDISSGAPVRIVIKSGGSIYGRVTGVAESDLHHVIVQASSAAGSADAAVDAKGNYRIEGSPTGTVRLSAWMTGGGMGAGRSTPEKSVQVEPGSSVQVDIEFLAGLTVRGRVTRDGKPIAGAVVGFRPRGGAGGAMGTAQATTDESGNYSMTGLTDGSYIVSVLDLQKFTPFTTTYDVRGSGTFDIDIRTSTVRGRVIDAATGEPVAGASVQLRKSGAVGPESMMSLRTAETNSNGVFLMEGVMAGTYSATAAKAGYGTEAREVIVTDSGSDAVDLKLVRNDGLALQVVDARDRRPLGARLIVYDAQNRIVAEEYFSTTADAARVRVAPGSYRVWVSAFGYAPRTLIVTSPSRQVVELTPGGTIAIRSKASSLRRARLIDASGHPYHARNPIMTIDASPGTTTLQNVAPGSYTIQVLGEGETVIASQVVVVREGQTTQVEM